jgi:glycosyltransferase involved in cell wall biosynthesis
MRILQIIYSLSSGGAERFIVDLSNELASSGNDVFLCVLLDDKCSSDLAFTKVFINDNVEFISLGLSPGFKFTTYFKIRSLINDIKPNIVHCHLNVVPYLFFEALFNKKIKIFHTLHNVAQVTLGRFQKPFNYFFYKTGRIKPITISDSCDESYRKFYNLSNAICITNGRSDVIPTTNYDTVKHEIESYKEYKDDLVFIHIARHHPQKNQKLLIDSFNKLYFEGNFHLLLIIIGSGYNKLEAIDLREKACSQIKFLGEKQNVGDYLLNSNAFCLTSNYEGLPISLIEALACGVVPICTPVGGIPNVIENGKTGYLSHDVSLKSYTSAILNFISAPYAISKRELKEYYCLNYSIEHCAHKYLALFSKETSNQ